jgi:phage-related protein
MGTIVAVLTAVWETIKVIFATAILVVYNIVTGHWDKIGEVFRAAGEKLWGIVSKLWETVKSLWVNAFNAVWQHTVQTWEAIKNAIMTGINAVVSFFSNAWNNFKSIVSNGWNAIISFFTSAPGKIMNAMSTIASNVKNAFVNMVSNAGEMGKNLVHGFINGVINLGGWIASKISGFFRDNVLGTAKRILGIASPSKVMKEFGKFTSEGLAIGISSNAGMAINSAEKMASGVVGAVAKMGELPVGVSASTSGVNTSYFVGASEGTDQGTGNGVAIQIGSLVVREEADIQKIAEQLYRLQKQGQRTRGSF